MAENDKPKATGFRKVLKVVGIVLGGLVGVFIVLMVVALIASGSGTAGDAQEAVAAGSTANDVTELRSEVAALTEQVARVDASVAALRRDLATLTDRVALVEVDAANRAAPERTAGAEAASLVAEAPRAVAVQTAPEPAQPAQRANSPEMWRGIVLAPEHRCSSYDSDDYRYSQSVEPRIVAQLGGIVYGPYTGRYFTDTGQTDIEHIVARSEAHDSGLCAASLGMRRRFAEDLRNLTLASPSVNRHQKIAYDAAEWLPPLNQCWYAARIVEVRIAYQLTIDRREAQALEAVLQGCDSFDLVVRERGTVATPAPAAAAAPATPDRSDPLALYDDNRNGRITCAEARAHRIAPVRRGHPAYRYMNDRDDDGIVCE